MAGKSDAFENDLLKLVFNAVNIPLLADNAASTPITSWYISLHYADPTDAASAQTTNEVTYTGYARVALVRTSGAWTVTGNSVSPVANIEFGACTAGTATATHVGIGSASTGAGKLFYYGAVSPSIAIASGVIPRLTTATTITED